MLAALCAAPAAFGPARAQPAGGESGGWTAGLQPMGWKLLRVGADTVTYVKPVETVDGERRMWSRVELRVPKKFSIGERSTLVQYAAFDCSTRRYAALHMEVYAGHNMTGAKNSSDITERRWTVGEDGSPAGALIREVCG